MPLSGPATSPRKLQFQLGNSRGRVKLGTKESARGPDICNKHHLETCDCIGRLSKFTGRR